ncbi:MAG: VanW family protein [Coriobacteriia bacterium]|nr:VanW family protein [Coriobacteriia bacterium]
MSTRPKSNASRIALLVVAGVVALLVLAVAVDAIASVGRIHPGVSIAGVNVGGKTVPEAVALLKTELPSKAAVPVTIKNGPKVWTVTAADVGATFDYGDLVDNAMAIGRSDGFFASLGQRVHAWFAGDKLPAPATADRAKLDAALTRVTDAIDVAPRDADIVVSGSAVTVKPSATGIAVDRALLESDVLGAFASDARAVAVRASTAQPRITDAEAEQAKAVVEKMLSAPVTITYATKSWPLSVNELAKMISAPAVETSGSGGWVLDPQVAAADASKTIVAKVGAALGNPPKNAQFKTAGGKVTIVPSKDGMGPDVVDFATNLTAMLKKGSPNRTVALRSTITPASFTTEEARAMGIDDRISTFSTSYDGSQAARTNNIHTLGSALDGKLVAPGATFSFNGYVGERTAAKGYQEANAIVKGKLVQQLGGGICQVGTTLFNTVFFSGMPVIERENHSFYISHYPQGRDATVSWGGPDLKWKNTTSSWMLISVSYTSDSITISLYGTNPGYDVSYTTGNFTNVAPFPTQEVKDPTLAAGVKVVQDPGENGMTCVVTRTVKKGSTVVRTDTFRSVYKPKIQVVQVGTAGKPSKTTTPTATKG